MEDNRPSRHLINGALWGAGFGFAFSLVLLPDFFYWIGFSPATTEPAPTEEMVSAVPVLLSTPPEIAESDNRYVRLGSSIGSISERSPLIAGDSQLYGRLMANGQPVPGAKVQFLVNDSAATQWALTDQSGHFYTSVPPGNYKVNGYRVDHDSVAERLKGLLPVNLKLGQQEAFYVTSGERHFGLLVNYQSPVEKPITRRVFSQDALPEALTWEPVHGAKTYEVRLLISRATDGAEKFVVSKPSVLTMTNKISLAELNDVLVPGHYFWLYVTARDANNDELAQTDLSTPFDFTVIE